MNAHTKLAVVLGALAMTVPNVAVAKPVNPSPEWNGTWKLNLAQSKFAVPGKWSETRTYQMSGNKVVLKSKGTDAAGKPVNFSYSAAYDGKWYPMVGNPRGDQISLSLVNSRRSNAKVKLKGKLSVTASLAVSPDGKRLTLERRTLRDKAAPVVETLKFDKVR